MRSEGKLIKSAMQIMDASNVPVLGLPLIEICGQRRVLIENHLGIIGYNCHEIVVKVRLGVVAVCGTGLHINKMSKEQLIITGNICAVNLRGK